MPRDLDWLLDARRRRAALAQSAHSEEVRRLDAVYPLHSLLYLSTSVGLGSLLLRSQMAHYDACGVETANVQVIDASETTPSSEQTGPDGGFGGPDDFGGQVDIISALTL